MSQSLRNAVYGVAASIGALLIVLGRVSEADVAVYLEVVGSILTLATTVLAAIYSRSTLIVAPADSVTPSADVVALVSPEGHVITGAASTLPTGDLVQLGRPVRDLIDPTI